MAHCEVREPISKPEPDLWADVAASAFGGGAGGMLTAFSAPSAGWMCGRSWESCSSWGLGRNAAADRSRAIAAARYIIILIMYVILVIKTKCVQDVRDSRWCSYYISLCSSAFGGV